jgi:type 2 lantibiotic biosynthesis protein LanM
MGILILVAPDQVYDGLLRDIAMRATPMFDRQLPATSNAKATHRATGGERRLKRWQSVLGSWALLERRLSAQNIAFDKFAPLLTGLQSYPRDLPGWAPTLASVLALPSDCGQLTPQKGVCDRSFDETAPLPFQEVLLRFVRHARGRFASELGSAADVLRPAAIAALERQLLAHLTFVANLTLGRDFYEYRFERAPASAFELTWCAQQTSKHIYREYLCEMERGRLVQLFVRHPVLARLLCQSVDQWVVTAVKFCRRFAHDFADLRMAFRLNVDTPEGALALVRTDLSDRHSGGQTVIECVIQTGERIIYKPRGVQAELVFFRFLQWLNSCGLSLNLMDLRVVDRTTHGWVQSVPAAPCRSESEVERFFGRAGMLLAVLHVLAVTDMHCDNLVAFGEHPVVVDLETLLNEGLRPGPASVADSGLLPHWQVAPDGQRFDMSALGADETQDPGVRLPSWQWVNTDQMMFVDDARATVATAHRVRFHDKLPSVADYLSFLLDGFEEGYFCLASNAQKLAADGRLLHSLDHLRLRVLVRDTRTYAGLQMHLLHPEFLEDGIERSVELEWLARPMSAPMAPGGGRARLYDQERFAMERLDIPYFDSADWQDMEITREDDDLFSLCGERDSDVMVRRLFSLSPAHYAEQRRIVEDAVRLRFRPS